jgi:hypothetical protein
VAGALDSIRTLIPTQGRTLLFERTLQVDSGSDLSLNLNLADAKVPEVSGGWRLHWVLLALLGIFLFALALPRLNRPSGHTENAGL